MDLQTKYRESLSNILPAGCGNGCHVYLLTVANRGRAAGLPPGQVFADLQAHRPRGLGKREGGRRWTRPLNSQTSTTRLSSK